MPLISYVVAMSRNGVIGKDGGLPWHIPSELQRFKRLTLGKPIIMGRRTWESLPKKPLPGRHNIVITRQKNYPAEGATVVPGKAEAMSAAGEVAEVAIIGGGEIYAMFNDDVDVIYLTEVDVEVEGDTYFLSVNSADWVETDRKAVAADPGIGTPAYILRRLERKR